MKTFVLTPILALLPIIGIIAQVRVAFVGVSNDGPDDFSFVAVTDIPANTDIFFTDEEYYDACDGFASSTLCAAPAEDYLRYNSGGAVVSSGTVVVIQEVDSGSPNDLQVISGPGIVTRGGLSNWSQATVDVMHAFLASNPSDPFGTLTEVLASFSATPFDPGNTNIRDNPIADHPNAIVFEDVSNMIDENADYLAASRSMPATIADLIDVANYTTTSSTSNITLATDNFSAAILPVTLISFTAKPYRKSVMVQWQTANEENNDYFDIERSGDGKVFEVVGKVAGHGTIDVTIDYAYLDLIPLSGTSYYRLRQVDYDGTFAYSSIAAVRMESEESVFSISPNPTKDEIRINWALETTSDAELDVEIYDVYGRNVMYFNLDSKTGEQAVLPLHELPSGNYFIRLVGPAGVVGLPQRLIKQ